MASSLLDDSAVYQRLDPEGMLNRIHDLPLQCRQAWEGSQSFPLPADYARVRNVAILGMGGSAIGGDVAASLAAGECSVPIQVVREYDIPAFVGPETLVIASSYSGATEETLSAVRQAREAGARLLAITTGGTLADLTRQAGGTVWLFQYASQPRAAFGFSLFFVLGALQRLGLLADQADSVPEALQVMGTLDSQVNERVTEVDNPAKQLAARLYGRLPLIYGGGVLSTVARRWKGQVNENAKGWSFFEAFPELNHNAVVGFQFPSELTERIFIVLLRGSTLHPRVLRRYEITQELLERAGVAYQVVEARGESPLSQVMSTVLLGDYASYYLALLYGTNPTPVASIDFLKARLANG